MDFQPNLRRRKSQYLSHIVSGNFAIGMENTNHKRDAWLIQNNSFSKTQHGGFRHIKYQKLVLDFAF